MDFSAAIKGAQAAVDFKTLPPAEQAQYLVTNKDKLVTELVGPGFSPDTASASSVTDSGAVRVQKYTHAALVATIKAAGEFVSRSPNFIATATEAETKWKGLLNGGYSLHSDTRSAGESLVAMLLRLKAVQWSEPARVTTTLPVAPVVVTPPVTTPPVTGGDTLLIPPLLIDNYQISPSLVPPPKGTDLKKDLPGYKLPVIPASQDTKVKALLMKVPTWGWVAGGAVAVVLLSVLMGGRGKK